MPKELGTLHTVLVYSSDKEVLVIENGCMKKALLTYCHVLKWL